MDAAELDALRSLSEREQWPVPDLPPELDLDMLRCLDELGFVEVQHYHWHNVQRFIGDDTPPVRTSSGPWHSPMKNPTIGGPWEVVLTRHVRDGRNIPCDIRISEAGKVALARHRRAEVAADPASELENALQDVWAALFNLHVVHDVEAQRQRVRAQWMKTEHELDKPLCFNEPADLAPRLAELFAQANRSRERALAAIRAGGCTAWNRAVEGGLQRSVDLEVKLGSVQVLLVRLNCWLRNHTLSIGSYISDLPQLSEWFDRARDECRAANAQAKFNAPPPVPTETSSGPLTKPKAGMTAEEARNKAEEHVRSFGYIGFNKLHKNVGCSKCTLRKAIKASLYLKARENEFVNRSGAGQATVTTTLALKEDTAAASNGTDPAVAAGAQVDDVLDRLLAASTPEEQSRLRTMPREKLLELEELVRQDPASLPSGLTGGGRDRSRAGKKRNSP